MIYLSQLIVKFRVGMSENLDDITLKNYLVKQNPGIFSNHSDITVIRSWPTKKNKNVFQTLLKVDVELFNVAVSSGHILIGFDSCAVYEGCDLPRCFYCNGFFDTKNIVEIKRIASSVLKNTKLKAVLAYVSALIFLT